MKEPIKRHKTMCMKFLELDSVSHTEIYTYSTDIYIYLVIDLLLAGISFTYSINLITDSLNDSILFLLVRKHQTTCMNPHAMLNRIVVISHWTSLSQIPTHSVSLRCLVVGAIPSNGDKRHTVKQIEKQS